MKLHRNAALSWSGRLRLGRQVVIEERSLAAAARGSGVSVRCARKWVNRYRAEGESGLYDRSSAPHRVANRTGQAPPGRSRWASRSRGVFILRIGDEGPVDLRYRPASRKDVWRNPPAQFPSGM